MLVAVGPVGVSRSLTTTYVYDLAIKSAAVHTREIGRVTRNPKSNVIGFALLDTPPLNLSCPSELVCEASSETGLWRTIDGGGSWRLQEEPQSGASPPFCVSAQRCFVGEGDGGVLETMNGGRSWTQEFVSAWHSSNEYVEEGVSSITCQTKLECLATAYAPEERVTIPRSSQFQPTEGAIAITRDGGRTWHGMSIPTDVNVRDASCQWRDMCLAVGGLSTSLVSGVLLRLSPKYV
jgi:hypothetical protein